MSKTKRNTASVAKPEVVRAARAAPANSNGTRPPTPESMRTKLTPELARGVLELLQSLDAKVEDHADDEFALVAAFEAAAAVKRAGAVKPVIDAMFVQLPCWSHTPHSTAGWTREELEALADDPSLRALRELKHTIYAALGGAYGDFADDAPERRGSLIEQALSDQCSMIGGVAEGDPAVKCMAYAASHMTVLVAYPLDGSDFDRETCLAAAAWSASAIGTYLAEARGREAFDAFVAALRGIHADSVQSTRLTAPSSNAASPSPATPAAAVATPGLTPGLVRAVLRELERQGNSGDQLDEVFTEALAGDDASLRVVVGVEVEAAIERSRSMRELVDLCIAQIPVGRPRRATRGGCRRARAASAS